MFVILAYAPILLCLPVLLLVGVVFVVVPGGFIVVLGGVYYAAMGLAGLLGLAAKGLWRAHASRVGRPNTTFENTSPSGRPSFGPRRAIAPNPVAVHLTHDRVVDSAPLGRTLPYAPARKDSLARPSSPGSETRA